MTGRRQDGDKRRQGAISATLVAAKDD